MGLDAAEKWQQVLWETLGEDRIQVPAEKATEFTFGNNEKIVSVSRLAMPGFINGFEFTFGVNVVDVQAPLLFGIDIMTALGMRINFRNCTCVFENIGPEVYR